jgi:hypothetical protein
MVEKHIPTIGSEHYAKASLGATEAETLLKQSQIHMRASEYSLADVKRQEALIQSNIANAHAMMSATAYEGYMLDELKRVVGEVTAAIRVHGS